MKKMIDQKKFEWAFLEIDRGGKLVCKWTADRLADLPKSPMVENGNSLELVLMRVYISHGQIICNMVYVEDCKLPKFMPDEYHDELNHHYNDRSGNFVG